MSSAASVTASTELKCPSAQPEIPGSEIFGVVLGTTERPEVAYLEATVSVEPKFLEPVTKAGLPATAVLRVAAPCVGSVCSHFDGRDCKLARKVVEHFLPAVDRLAFCAIRTSCRWFAQEGKSACQRCAGIVTAVSTPSEGQRFVADPLTRPGTMQDGHITQEAEQALE